jgi:hypothetical protein
LRLDWYEVEDFAPFDNKIRELELLSRIQRLERLLDAVREILRSYLL